MRVKKIFCLLLILLLAVNLVGCSSRYKKFTDYSFDFFDTVTSIIGFEKDEEAFERNCVEIKEKLEEYHKLYTIYSRYDGINNLCVINNSNTPICVDSKITDMLEFSKKMYDLTFGKVNVAMGSVLSIWHDYREHGIANPDMAELPEISQLENAAKHTNINSLIIEGNTVYLNDSAVRLDVGAIAKGYATEQIAQWMENVGITGYLLNVGGNIRVVGDRPDGKKWQIGLENPDKDNMDEPYTELLELTNVAIVTSGSYQRYYTVDGKNYHHIIDPDTLMPADSYKMVSVINESSAVADALSTALFCMDIEEGKKIVDSLENTSAMWITDDGKKYYSENFKDYVK